MIECGKLDSGQYYVDDQLSAHHSLGDYFDWIYREDLRSRNSDSFSILLFFSVVNQYYEAEVVSEYVIKGNTAVLKCNIPSFVADFVKVEAWVASDNTEFLPSNDFG